MPALAHATTDTEVCPPDAGDKATKGALEKCKTKPPAQMAPQHRPHALQRTSRRPGSWIPILQNEATGSCPEMSAFVRLEMNVQNEATAPSSGLAIPIRVVGVPPNPACGGTASDVQNEANPKSNTVFLRDYLRSFASFVALRVEMQRIAPQNQTLQNEATCHFGTW
jgi:hypothetical protein